MSAQTFYVTREQQRKTLLDFIAESLSVSKKHAKRLIDAKSVFVNEKRVWIASHAVLSGDVVKVYGGSDKKSPQKLTTEAILYRDDHYLVINKPPGVVSNGDKSIESALRSLLKDRKIRAVHRLDKDTSGCIIFAFNDEAFEKAVEAFKDKDVLKKYHALCVGSYRAGKKTVRHPIDGKEAVSHIECLKVLGEVSLLEVIIETGRTHQIRKHLLSIGYPVLGDKEYTTKRSTAGDFRSVSRQMLHAVELAFVHPYTDKSIKVKAPYPIDFKSLADA